MDAVIVKKVRKSEKGQKKVSAEKVFLLKFFPSHINPKVSEYQGSNMSYVEFLIPKELKFFRNIYSEEALKKSESLKDLKIYYEAFKFFLEIIIDTEDSLKSCSNFDQMIDKDLKEFCETYSSNYSNYIKGLIDYIKQVGIKKCNIKISKFTLQHMDMSIYDLWIFQLLSFYLKL